MRTPLIAALMVGFLAATATGLQETPHYQIVAKVTVGNVVNDISKARSVCLCDWDNNNTLDAFIVNRDGQSNKLYFNGGGGLLVLPGFDPGSIDNDGGDSRGFAVADVDMDGDKDIYVCNSSAQPNFLYLNQTVEGGGPAGTTPGRFTRVTSGPPVDDSFNSRHAEFADVDNDGDPDLFVVNWNDEDNQLFINQTIEGGGPGGTSDGEFTRHTTGDAVNDGGYNHGLAFADVDLDGFMDLFVAAHDGLGAPVGVGAVNRLYLGDGTGDFTYQDVAPFKTHVDQSLAARFGDFDQDGDRDLYVANDGQNNRLYLNRTKEGGGPGGSSDGVFDEVTGIEPVMDGAKSVGCHLGDVDGDGLLDIAVANRGNQQNRIYYNSGDFSGNSVKFHTQNFGPMFNDTGNSYDVAIGDLNGDTRNDVVVANQGDPAGPGEKNFVYRNLRRQWADLGGGNDPDVVPFDPPTMGSVGNFAGSTMVTLNLDNMTPNRVAGLFINFTSTPLPYGGGTFIPTLPATLVVFNSGPTGSLPLSGSIPPVLGAGLELFMQAAVDRGPLALELTNALRVETP